ncbi:unnamed protein product [Polarella glacialis]|uniref:Uncharacterized protein n=2 Tax=Polarella glacialis TaxID=89957 RepID=A0A813LGH3_POLGL|nr:unnamed protein product [Polarella glacialis]
MLWAPRAASACRRQQVARASAVERRRFLPGASNLQKVVSASLEAAAENGRQAVNTALAISGSSLKFKVAGAEAFAAEEDDASRQAASENLARQSVFWNPYGKGSPFEMGREAFIAKHLAKAADSRSLVPDADVERYVDLLLSQAVLSNIALPAGVGRQLYIRVVRIVHRVIINALGMMEGEVLGKELRFLKQPSEVSKLHLSPAGEFDPRVIKLLAKRSIGDHVNSDAAYLKELGLPTFLIESLYEDIIALSVRLVFDVSLTFQIRCLGHKLTCEISPDAMLHTAPGWEVALEEGAFGLFEDKEKRRWAKLFVNDLLHDKTIHMSELPDAFQKQLYSRVALVLLNLSETAFNHFRIHVAGMAIRPALLHPLEPSADIE